MSANEVVWEKPANADAFRAYGKGGRLALQLAPLLANPGRWARFRVHEKRRNFSSLRDALMGGTHAKRYLIPPGRWEAVTRKLYEGEDQGKFALYVRYMGPPAEPTE